jgi:hypothetical protein
MADRSRDVEQMARPVCWFQNIVLVAPNALNATNQPPQSDFYEFDCNGSVCFLGARGQSEPKVQAPWAFTGIYSRRTIRFHWFEVEPADGQRPGLTAAERGKLMLRGGRLRGWRRDRAGRR